MKTYVGIVDALGLESFKGYDAKSKQEMEERLRFLQLRAQFNPQRNAIAYKIKLGEETIEVIEGLMKKELFRKAGKIITTFIDKIEGTALTAINKNLYKVYKLRGYL